MDNPTIDAGGVPLPPEEFDAKRLRGLLGRFAVVDAILRAPEALARRVRSEADARPFMQAIVLVVLAFGAAWVLLYVVVLCQMGTYLRPWWEAGPFRLDRKELFCTAMFGR